MSQKKHSPKQTAAINLKVMNEPFSAEQTVEFFENSARQNGQTWWHAHWLMGTLGYKDFKTFLKLVNEAIGSCMRLGVCVAETFQQIDETVDGQSCSSYRMNRFGCYLVVMHADIKKEEVLRIRGYLAAFAAAVAERQFDNDALLRVELREKLKDGEALMSGVAFRAGLKDMEMAIFKDAGYQGMYNMPRRELVRLRGLNVKDILYDYMGVVELAAHNYRVTQTAERIRTRGLHGLHPAKNAAFDVGKKVRADIIENTGVSPECLSVEENIKQVESGLRKTSRNMKKVDDSKRRKLLT